MDQIFEDLIFMLKKKLGVNLFMNNNLVKLEFRYNRKDYDQPLA